MIAANQQSHHAGRMNMVNRTIAVNRLKVPPHVKLECLGHARQGVGDIHYSHYDYLDEQREDFEAWAGHVERLVYPDGVVGLHG